MDYIPRHAEKTIDALSKMFGAVLVTGARQVGKSTLLEQVTAPIPTLTFDNAGTRAAAANAPELFFSYNAPPIYLDEIQKAPDLFSEMKQIIDKTKAKGLFYLSGSEQFSLMEKVSDSLAGRIGILNLCGLSLREEHRIDFTTPFVPTQSYYAARKIATTPTINATNAWERIHRGSMPELLANSSYNWGNYYGAYIQTYIERDVRKLTQVADELQFQTFMTVLAARTGHMLNLADVAKVTGISEPTAKRWLSILRTSNIVYLLRPYFSNRTKRAIKTPKLYFTDTGLAAYLTKWNTPEVLRNGAMAGAFFETFTVMEVLKSYCNEGVLDPPLYYYRDQDKNEIDLLIHQNGKLHPVEIKTSSTPTKSDIHAFRHIEKLDLVRGEGGVICLSEALLPLTEHNTIIPLSYI